MTTHAAPKIVVCAVALATASACAHGAGTRTLASRLVHGKPEAHATLPAPQPDISAWVARMRELQANAKPPMRPPVLTAENTDPALQRALARVAVSPTSANHVEAGLAYYHAGILDIAQDQLAEAVRLDGTAAAAYDLQARIWRDWGFANLALPDAYRAVYFAPRSPEARNTLGTVFLALGRIADARSAYLKATEIDVRASYAWSNLCHVRALEGDLRGAEQACRRALAIDPGLAAARKSLDRIYVLATEPVPGSGGRP